MSKARVEKTSLEVFQMMLSDSWRKTFLNIFSAADVLC